MTNHALQIMDARVDESEAEYMFNVILIGRLQHIDNKYNAGAVSETDKNSWMVGLAIQFPLFSGFSTKYKVQELKHRIRQLNQQKLLVKDGLKFQLETTLNNLYTLSNEVEAARSAMKTAIENRDLTERAYAIEMASAEEMIQAQLLESIMIAKFHKVLYDYLANQARTEFLVGKQLGF